VRQAVTGSTLDECTRTIERELTSHSINLENPSTWREPVVRFVCPQGPEFARAAASPLLHSLFDDLLGEGNWIKRAAIGGTVPVRFPSNVDPGDAGWHIDGSFEVNGQYWVNVFSQTRALLLLYLFSDVTEDDAPTEILSGSHMDVPAALLPYGREGVFFGDVMQEIPPSAFARPRIKATGRAGDVFVCHPFLIHRATWPHLGCRPRIIAQPELGHSQPFALIPGSARGVVEQTILDALSADG
jgi:hypothetical protein